MEQGTTVEIRAKLISGEGTKHTLHQPGLLPRPYQPHRFQYPAWGGGSGDFSYVSMFSAGFRAEPIVLQIVIQCHAITQLVDT